MYLKLILLFIILNISLFAKDFIELNPSKHYYETTKTNQYVLLDNEKKLTLNDVVNSNKFEKSFRTNFPPTPSTYWSKIKLKNVANQKKRFYLQNERTGLDKIDVFIYEKDTLLKSYKLGDLRQQEQRETLSRKSTFFIELEPKIIYTIYFKYESFGGITTLWQIESEHMFQYNENLEVIIWGLFAGIMLTLIIYNFIVYFVVKDISFIIYILLTFTVAFYQLNVNGIFYLLELPFDLYTLTYLNWQIGMMPLVFLVLFPMYFFKIEKHTIFYKFFFFILLLSISQVLFYMYAYIDPAVLYLTKYTNYLSLIIFLLLTYTSIWAIIKKKEGAIYYFIGHISYLGLVSYFMLIILGHIETSKHSWVGFPLALTFDIIFLSLALHTKIKAIKEKNIESEKLLLTQSRFATMGQSIANLTHQWKAPISQIASQVFLIKATKDLNKDNLEKTVDEIVPQMENSVNVLNDTIDDIYNIYANPNNKEKFFIEKEIKKVLNIFKTKIDTNNILINYDYISIEYFGYKNSFLNIIISILENAFYELIKNKKNAREINIIVKDDKDIILISIEDNAGGIKTSNINDIFKIDYSTKENEGSGIGLALTKKLVETRLNGEIKVRNRNKGATFIIEFRKY